MRVFWWNPLEHYFALTQLDSHSIVLVCEKNAIEWWYPEPLGRSVSLFPGGGVVITPATPPFPLALTVVTTKQKTVTAFGLPFGLCDDGDK